jgi:hypothetical protein
MNTTSASVMAPLPPAVEIIAHGDGARRYHGRNVPVGTAAVLCAFNGVQHRAVIDVGPGNQVRSGDIADMLEALAAKVRAG